MLNDILKRAKQSSKYIGALSSDKKNLALLKIAEQIVLDADEILKENKKDIENATHLSKVMIDRLLLTKERIVAMSEGVKKVATLNDPVGRVINSFEGKNGLKISKISVPFGVVAVIFESRPNVSLDTSALTIKSGNACVLRCGKDSYYSCKAIVNSIKKALKNAGFNEDIVNLVEDRSRESANLLMTAKSYVDLLIPRGGAGLIKACVENATVPCIETGTGICHIYVDESAKLDMALNIVENAKTSRPSVCNAEEVLLVNEKIAPLFLPKLKKRLVDDRIEKGLVPVELKLCSESLKIIEGTVASDIDFSTEFLDYILAVKIVKNVDEAIMHIEEHSTHHSEAIITENEENSQKFIQYIDSSSVYVNASTRFTDGGEFGNGAEIGISTQKLHARGPMGINELNTYKYVIIGNGQIR